MQDLHIIIHSLGRGELEVLKNYLDCFAVGKSKSEKRSLQLVKLLAKAKTCPTDKKISDKLYGKGAPPSKISMLKSRLRDKIVDSLIVDTNLSRMEHIDAFDMAMIRVRKKLAQFQYMYYSKSSLPITTNLLNDIISISKEYELYSTLVEALKYKKWMDGFSKGEKEFDRLNREVEHYDYCNKAVNRASDAYFRLIITTNFAGSNNIKKQQDMIQASLNELKKDIEVTRSAVVEYYFKVLEFAYYDSKKNYLKGRSACLDLINIIRRNKSVFRKQRIAIAYEHISTCEVHLANYKNAIEYAQLAQKNIVAGSANYFIAQEHEFRALFHGGQYKKAADVAKSLVASVNPELGDFRYAKYCFYHANTLFAQDKFKEALRILNQHLDLSSDKTGWDIAVRVLAIMCCIELENDKASAMVENLRKHVEYSIKNNHEMKERDSRIVKILHYLQANGFRYDKTNAKLIANTDLLRSQKSCPWEPFTPELIPFHEWLEKHYHLKRTTEKVLVE